MSQFDPDYCYDYGPPHDWQRDPQHRREGLVCTLCGLSEAELEGLTEAEIEAGGW